MKYYEQCAQKYLNKQFGDVKYEPSGNCGPDFLCDNKTAVETRLLNQHEKIDGIWVATDFRDRPMSDNLKRVYSSYKRDSFTGTWFVSHSFMFPPPAPNKVANYSRDAICSFLADTTVSKFDFENGRFSITFTRASESSVQPFILGGWINLSSGGWIASELSKNLEICVVEKATKIEKHKVNYSEWWLVLVDQIALAAETPIAPTSLEYLAAVAKFDKVVLINYDGTKSQLVK